MNFEKSSPNRWNWKTSTDSALTAAMAAANMKYGEMAKRDIGNALRACPQLYPNNDMLLYPDRVNRNVVTLSGTLPVLHRSNRYNIPVCLYLWDSHPTKAPVCYVRPQQNMMLKTSQFVGQTGKIDLPYLNEWTYPKYDLQGLLEVMVATFQENCPVFATNGQPQQTYPAAIGPSAAKQQTQYPSYHTQPCYPPSAYAYDGASNTTNVTVNEHHLILSNDLARLLDNQDSSDCTLQVGGKEVKVHKLILAARSPVFAAMFNHGMMEAEKDRIDISDIEAEVMQQLIKYIYTGNAPELDEMALQLLAAADKYQLDLLKNTCESSACAQVSASNACEMLVVSHLHSANQLKTHAIRCINENADKVVESEGWNEMVNNYPQLIAEVFKAKNSKK